MPSVHKKAAGGAAPVKALVQRQQALAAHGPASSPTLRQLALVHALLVLQQANPVVIKIGDKQPRIANGDYPAKRIIAKIKLRCRANAFLVPLCAARNRAYGPARQVDGADKVIAGIGNIQRVSAYGCAFGVGKPRSRSRAIGIARSSTARKVAHCGSGRCSTYGNRADALIIPVGNVGCGALYGNAKRKAKSCRSIPATVCVPKPIGMLLHKSTYLFCG